MKKKLWVIIVLIALGSIAGVYLTKDSRAYNKAEKLVAEGDYAGALVYYNEAGYYPDLDTAYEKRNYCGYKLAEAAVAVRDWETAIKYYEDVQDVDQVQYCLDQEEYCKQEWTKELIQPILDEYGLTDATLIHFRDEDTYPDTRSQLIYFDHDDVKSYAQGWNGMPVYHSNMFGEFTDEEKMEFFQKIHEVDHINGYYTGIQTDTHTYVATHSIAKGWNLESFYNAQLPYISDFIDYFYYTRGHSSSSSSSSSGNVCSRCNGTGGVRYNYGSSDLEAVLSGHDPYTYGTCGSCGGTGRAK